MNTLFRPPTAVLRAAAEMRRGGVVRLAGAGGPALVAAAETMDAAVLNALAGSGVLVLARRRAEQAFGGPAVSGTAHGAELAAYALPAGGLPLPVLRSLTDPTAAQVAIPALAPAPLPAAAAAAVALAKLGRLLPAVVVAGAEDGAAADVDGADVLAFPAALAHGLRRVAEAEVPLDCAPDARVVAFRPLDGGMEHLAILVGRPELQDAPLVRVHSACLTGDLLGSLRCDCGPQLRAALARMQAEGAGALLYLAQEGRGIGIVNKLRAYAVQDRGEDTVDANLSLGWAVDERNFLAAAVMLEQLSIPRVRLLTNNPAKLAAMQAAGVEVVARVPHVMAPNGVNDGYLEAKATRLGHLLG